MISAVSVLRRGIRSLGWPGAIGTCLVIVAMGSFLSLVRPLEERQREAISRLESLARRPAGPEAALRTAAMPVAKIAAFYAFFDSEREVTDHLATLYSIARASGIELRLGEYRLQRPAGLRLAGYAISLPVTGNYAQIRNFVEGALDEIPVLTLDQVSFRRKKVSEAAVEADIRMTLYITRP